MAKKKTESAGTKKKAASPEPRTPPPVVRSAEYEKALAAYAAAIDRLHRRDYAGALERFKAIEAENLDEPELGERVRTYASICVRKLVAPPVPPTTADGFYHLGVVRINEGKLDEALSLLERSLKLEPDSARGLYARASVQALKGRAEAAAADLRRAVAIEPHLRYQAASDPDFEKVRDEAAFIDVIEPTPAGA